MEKRSLLDQWKSRQAGKSTGIPPRHPEAPIPAAPGQGRLWTLQQLHPENPFYQYAHRYDIRGDLAVDQLIDSLHYMVERQEILRSQYALGADGEVKMKIATGDAFVVGRYPNVSARELERKISAFALKPYRLDRDLPFRAALFQLGPDHYVLVLAMHHIIGDRGSLLLLHDELFRHYTASAGEGPLGLPELPIQYADYAAWRANRDASSGLDAYLELLGTPPAPLALPFDFEPPSHPTYRGGIRTLDIPPETARQIKSLARGLGTTPNVIVLASFQLLLYRYTGQENFYLGSPVSTRDRTELDHLVGFFNETAIIPGLVRPIEPFSDLVDRVRRRIERAISHADVGFERVVARLAPGSSPAENPLFRVMYVFNSLATPPHLPDSLSLTERSIELGTAKFDLTLFAGEVPNGFRLTLEYGHDRWRMERVQRLLENLQVLLTAAVATPDLPVGRLPLLTETEKAEILLNFQSPGSLPGTPSKSPPSVWSYVAENFDRFGEAMALSDPSGSMTYAELQSTTLRLARRLRRSGVRPGEVVALVARRDRRTPTAMLGVMRAGAAYLPIDPAYPVDRIAFMLKDAGVRRVVTLDDGFFGTIDAEDFLEIPYAGDDPGPEPDLPEISGHEPAYLIYTSGSTGRPKGVVVSHQNLVASTSARFSFFRTSPDRFLLLSSFSFDSSVAGIYWSLSSGGCLVVAPERIEQDIEQLAKMIREHRITHTLLLPSLYRILLELSDTDQLASLRCVMVAGEACSADLVRRHHATLPGVELVNEYGPTETTVWSTAARLLPTEVRDPLPIGRPVPGYQNYVLDAQRQLLPVGAVGELYVGGAGVSQGYHGRPRLTSDRFSENPFGPGKLYRTGDAVRYRPDGSLLFLGRVDRQVKIRGHRVEPGEVETQLLQHPDVREVAVRVMTDDTTGGFLWAYFVADDLLSDESLDRFAAQRLPEHFRPRGYQRLDRLPRLPNGKLDRSALAAPTDFGVEIHTAYRAPSSVTEATLVDLFSEILRQDRIGVDDDFFRRGGNSLASIRLIAAARKRGLPIQPSQLFTASTPLGLAREIERAGREKESELIYRPVVPLKASGAAPPLFCLHSGGGHVFFYRPLAERLREDRPLYAIQPPGLAGEATTFASIESMAEFYLTEIRRVQPRGPYHILGTCFSNAVGLEIAHRLRNEGEEIALLVFVDSGPAHLEAATPGDRQTLSRFSAMVRDRNWRGIQKKIRNRGIRLGRRLISRVNAEKKKLYGTIRGLNQLYAAYHWKPYDGKIILIRSTEFASRADKQFHLDQWQKLADGGLDVEVISGHHLTLFSAPEVEGLAQTLNDRLAP